jgi:hypothetical protein
VTDRLATVFSWIGRAESEIHDLLEREARQGERTLESYGRDAIETLLQCVLKSLYLAFRLSCPTCSWQLSSPLPPRMAGSPWQRCRQNKNVAEESLRFCPRLHASACLVPRPHKARCEINHHHLPDDFVGIGISCDMSLLQSRALWNR